jgi:hypothetical protein
MECWKTVSPDKMHGSWRGSKAFQGRLSIIEAVDLKFTSAFSNYLVPQLPEFKASFFPKVLIPMEAAFQPFWVKLFSTLPQLVRI